MTWATAIQTFLTGMAGIATYFLYELVKEFRSFKVETKTDIGSLKSEREEFKNTVRNAELGIRFRVNEMEKIHNDFSLNVQQRLMEMREEITKTKFVTSDVLKQAEKLNEYMKNSFQLSKALNEKIKRHEEELISLKVRLGSTTVFKG